MDAQAAMNTTVDFLANRVKRNFGERPMEKRDMSPKQEAPRRKAWQINPLSEAIGVSRSGLYKMIKTGQLRAIKLGGRTLIMEEDVDALLRSAA
jgi:excisionase family DNA binding protein